MKVRLNERINNNVYHKLKFIEVTEQAITFHLDELSEKYILVNVTPDLEKYALQFIEFIKPVLKDFLREINYGGTTFRIVFKHKGDKIEKVFTVLNKDDHG
ncbi:hypothetical protein AY601_4062 [Pedobacter cryoconitis]|uniref:Uncharacterized protein n=1 Tax=Pedobacter cryoconitis TaxID=188932 RepID=A0A127VHY5_9SPHI|nr:hypothetical protein [Pedobacter cryoconitis]AMQ00913.1 hypothetical protein AY601_4062 [Pedobacter cryoconitis]